MIKAILYHSFEEKEKLEMEIFSKIPVEQRISRSTEFVDLFFDLNKDNLTQNKKKNAPSLRK